MISTTQRGKKKSDLPHKTRGGGLPINIKEKGENPKSAGYKKRRDSRIYRKNRGTISEKRTSHRGGGKREK